MKNRITQFQSLFIVTLMFIKKSVSINCSFTFGSSTSNGYSFESGNLRDLDCLFLSYDQNYVYAVQFNYTNGNPNQYTNSTITDIIKIKNKIITGVKIQSDRFINTLQLEIFDPSSNQSSWTSIMGSNRSDLVYLSAESLNSSYFNIQVLNQSVQMDLKIFSFVFLRKLIIFYESENCKYI
jgi:hypothetical protein